MHPRMLVPPCIPTRAVNTLADVRTVQGLSIQEAALRAAGCEVVGSEKRTGTTTAGRDELRTVLDFLRAGDVLMVTRIDRLARSIGDLQDSVRAVQMGLGHGSLWEAQLVAAADDDQLRHGGRGEQAAGL
jgi:hypothetical protein